ncbi:MAG: T9SS type A sorting domain-containing protein, partial [Urechidicola sp.]|nr:T9SS type A sorting domain-containing protein [Urechidicola sp.]
CERLLSAGPVVILVNPAPAPVFDQIDPDTITCEEVANYIPELLGYSNGIDGTCGISGDIRGVAEAFDGSCGSFEVNFSYESCGELITASQTITVIDETAPMLVGELPQGMSDVDACLAGAPAPPTEEYIEGLFTDNCGNVNATLEIISPEENTDCLWAVLYRYTIVDDCNNYAAPVKIYHNGGDKTAPVLVLNLPEGVTGLQCMDENPGAPDLQAIKDAYTDNCGDVVITPFEPYMTGDNCGWSATYEYEVKDTCGNKLPNIVITNSGADTIAPELDGEIPVGMNTVNACKDSDLGEPTEEEIAALFSDNCGEITAENVTKIEKLSIGSNCEWIRVFEYIVTDGCNAYPTFKVNYQGGDTGKPVKDPNCSEGPMVLTTEMGAICPADAVIDLAMGDYITPEGLFTVAGLDLSQMQAALPLCFSDNCTAVDDLKYIVISVNKQLVDSCAAILTVEFAAEDLCENISEDVMTCTFIINDTTAPVLTCPEGEDFGLVDVTPSAFDLKATWTDNCQGSGETGDYLDSDISEAIGDDFEAGISTSYYSFDRTFYANDGCGNIGECTVTYSWSISSQGSGSARNTQLEDKKIDFKVFPVPFDNEVTLTYEFDYRTDVTIEFYDTKGLLILSETNSRYVAGSIGRTKLDLSRTSSQVFYVKLTTNQGTVTKKIVSSGK